MKQLAYNKRIRYDYEIIDSYIAGIVLTGTEIKSIRMHRFNIRDAFVRIKNDEAFVHNLFIDEYEQGNQFNHEPTRMRKLLLHKQEIKKLYQQVKEGGLTIVVLQLGLENGRCKLEIALAKGKKNYDKRESIKLRDEQRHVSRSLKIKNR